MNRFERRVEPTSEAVLEFLDGDFKVVKPGAFVRCAVTGTPIPVEELRYWNVDLQEAYVAPSAKLIRLGIAPPTQS